MNKHFYGQHSVPGTTVEVFPSDISTLLSKLPELAHRLSCYRETNRTTYMPADTLLLSKLKLTKSDLRSKLHVKQWLLNIRITIHRNRLCRITHRQMVNTAFCFSQLPLFSTPLKPLKPNVKGPTKGCGTSNPWQRISSYIGKSSLKCSPSLPEGRMRGTEQKVYPLCSITEILKSECSPKIGNHVWKMFQVSGRKAAN